MKNSKSFLRLPAVHISDVYFLVMVSEHDNYMSVYIISRKCFWLIFNMITHLSSILLLIERKQITTLRAFLTEEQSILECLIQKIKTYLLVVPLVQMKKAVKAPAH